MTAPKEARRPGQWLEWVMALAVLGGFIYMAVLTFVNGYFPQPFFWDADDTYRDWFSTALWAYDSGAYDTWLTVYPPLSFVILKVVSLSSCYEFAFDKTARACDWIGIIAIHLIYVVNAVLISKTMMKIDRQTALPRSFALVAGMPMIFGLERGNLILLCFTCVLLGFGPLVKSAKWRWLNVGLAVNLKIYLVAGVFIHLLKRRWRWFEGALIATIAVYLVSYGIYGAGTPVEIYDNLVNFATGSKPGSVLDIWYPNTYIPLHYVLAESDAPVNLFIGSREVNLALILIPLFSHSAQAIILAAAAATWLRPEVVPPFRLTFFAFALAMITSETSAYTQPIMILFVFMERWRGWARPAAIICCYILCIPGDIWLGAPSPTLQYSYIGGRLVFFEAGLTLGMFAKPLVFMMPAYFLGLLTIRDVWHDIRSQGWKDRWRFRHDLPLLPGVIRPRPPQPKKILS